MREKDIKDVVFAAENQVRNLLEPMIRKALYDVERAGASADGFSVTLKVQATIDNSDILLQTNGTSMVQMKKKNQTGVVRLDFGPTLFDGLEDDKD